MSHSTFLESSRQPAIILLADDSVADQTTVSRALEDGRVYCSLITVNNGEQALRLLSGDPPYNDRKTYPFPDLVLLDINMPVLDGKSTLERIRQDQRWCRLPVIMLTTSESEMDVNECYDLGANAYLTKPVRHEDFVKVIVGVEQFWFELVTLPKSAQAKYSHQLR